MPTAPERPRALAGSAHRPCWRQACIVLRAADDGAEVRMCGHSDTLRARVCPLLVFAAARAHSQRDCHSACARCCLPRDCACVITAYLWPCASSCEGCARRLPRRLRIVPRPVAPFNVQSHLSAFSCAASAHLLQRTLKCSALCVVRHTRHRTGLPRRRTPTPLQGGRRTWAWSFCARSARKEWTTLWKEFCRCHPASCLPARCLRPLCDAYALRQLRAT